MGLLEGLKRLGLGDLEKKQIYEQEKKQHVEEKKKEEKKPVTEEDCLYIKQFICPLCNTAFSQPVVKAGRLRLVGQDPDLRPKYADIDANKYDVVHCNSCGYAALQRYFGPLAGAHKKLLKDEIQMKYQPIPDIGNTISYEQARVRYQLALVNAMVRKAHNSEKAMICLRAGWLARGMQEEAEKNVEIRLKEIQEAEEAETEMTETVKKDYQERKERAVSKAKSKQEKLKAEEEEYLQNALDGFMRARMEEQPPVAGMNEVTLDYLLGVLCMHFKRYDNAYKLLQGIVSSKTAGNSQKEKARDMLNEIRQLQKNKSPEEGQS